MNTLMIQDLLAEPDWDDVLTPEDQRGLTPLFWSHVLPYGEAKLNDGTSVGVQYADHAELAEVGPAGLLVRR